MDAILYVCHGSRVKSAVHSAIHFVMNVQEQIDCQIQEIAFVELAEPSIYKGLETCLNRGAKTISVLPVLLLSANHAKVDIPNEIALFQEMHPTIKIKIANPIGVHENMIELVMKRIFEQVKNIHSDSTIVLVGRGSSDRLTQLDFLNIVKLLKSKINRHVLPAYMAVSKPSIHDVWESLAIINSKQIIIVPYLFFSGTLMNELTQKITALPPELQKDWILCETLGYDHLITSIFKQRLLEVRSNKLVVI
ncbi:sirohydrochlorin chelatase [Bacillus sp. EAC]|uniref:sirohydrochlorin chelatase n=1 Tax=Bacillus sp. EAC TaxID=1978338 RepID=UPI000B4426DF|nr:sirohydrochlorin chelatase [Bacillus sp. EAC]